MRVPSLCELMQSRVPRIIPDCKPFRKVRSYFLWCKRVAWLSVCCFTDFIVQVLSATFRATFRAHSSTLFMWILICASSTYIVCPLSDPVRWLCVIALLDDCVRWPCAVTLSDHPVWRCCMMDDPSRWPCVMTVGWICEMTVFDDPVRWPCLMTMCDRDGWPFAMTLCHDSLWWTCVMTLHE